MDRLLETSGRFKDETFYRAAKGLMTVDACTTVPFLLRKGQATGEKQLLNAAVVLVLNHLRHE